MPEAVSRLPYTTQAQVHSQAGVFEICGGQSDSGTHFDLSLLFHPFSAILTWKAIYRGCNQRR